MKTLGPRVATLGSRTSTGWAPDSQRGTRQQRGYGRAWEVKREHIARRANGLCEPHLRIGEVHVGTDCDHVLPKAEGGSDREENLQWCCKTYHAKKTALESNGLLHGLTLDQREAAILEALKPEATR